MIVTSIIVDGQVDVVRKDRTELARKPRRVSDGAWRSLDVANKHGDEVGGGDTSGEEALGIPVGLDGGDVGGDCLLVEEVVLGGGGDKSLGGLEDSSPLLNGLDVVTHVGARSNIELEVVDELLQLLHSFDDVEALNVDESGIEVGEERGDTSVAGLHLSEVVVANHSVDETGGEVGEGQKVHADNLLSRLDLNGADGGDEEISGGLTRSEVVSGSPVALDESDVGIHGFLVEDH